MALDLTGITNENEFYTHHYLTAILENDLRGLLGQWEEKEKNAGIKPPYDRLARLNKDYFALRNQMERLRRHEERLSCQREFFSDLLDALGFSFTPDLKELDSGFMLPIVGEVRKKNGAPDLWIIEALSPVSEDTDPLECTLVLSQYGDIESDRMLPDSPLSDIITKQVFTLAEPPRWIILLSFSHAILLDRSKWNERRFLRFDLAEILGRRVPATLRAVAALLHRESICPEDGISLLDTLDENSHKHAFAVSEDLKYSAREAVELLGNEAVFYIRQKKKGRRLRGSGRRNPRRGATDPGVSPLPLPPPFSLLHRSPAGIGLRPHEQRGIPHRLQPGFPAGSGAESPFGGIFAGRLFHPRIAADPLSSHLRRVQLRDKRRAPWPSKNNGPCFISIP